MLRIIPEFKPELDPGFVPAALVHRALRAAVGGSPQKALIGLEQSDGSFFRYDMELPSGAPTPDTVAAVERLVKFLLWSRGACRVYWAGPPAVAAALEDYYCRDSRGRFDALLMGDRIYGRPFEIRRATPEEMPPAHSATRPLGRHSEGCRIGFDLGASDRKVAAVVDGRAVFSEEVEWSPGRQADPQWHFDQIMDSLRRAAAHLPRVDAIGGSAAGVYVNNRVRVASLFRAVPDDLFSARVVNIFAELQRAWNDIPFEVVNDGEVTALAGSMSLNVNGMLGIAMGSSEAAGFVNREGNITTWLNELAFAPVDYRRDAPLDEWSGDRGCGVQYFSQQAVGRLIGPAGLTEIEAARPLPEKLVAVQELMAAGDERAASIYRTIGVYLGYTLAHYAEFYDMDHVLLLGRVTSGEGGGLIRDRARMVLETEFPELFGRLGIHMPDEKDKRHGQAVAAASLPAIRS